MYRLIAADLDGTLLNDAGEIPPVNAEYIKKATDLGILVALCSGRSYISLGDYEEQLGLNRRGGYGICFNGGIVYDAHKKEIIQDIRMDREVAFAIISELKRVGYDPEVGTLVYDGADLYADLINENTKPYAARSKIELKPLSVFVGRTGNPSKVVLKGSNSALSHISRSMSGFVKGKCRMYFSSNDLLEFVPLESGKGQGLRSLAGILGIPMSETIAVGDQVNDIDMLEAAGVGVAVANAVPAVKSAANYIAKADNNSGVIREIMERFIEK